MLKKKLFKKIAAAVAALCVITSTAVVPAQADESRGVILPLPAGRGYKISVLGKYSWNEYHRSYISADIYKTGAGGDSYCLMDIVTARKTPIYAIADGVVYNTTSDKVGGNKIVIKHNDGSFSYYGHMESKTTFKVGDSVSCGNLVGYVGSSGHLHFEWGGHDPFCEFIAMGYDLSILNDSGASVYPHDHNTFYYAKANGTDGSLAINQRAKTNCEVGNIPEGAVCKVYPDRSYKNWLYVEYNGVRGFSYKKYLVETNGPMNNTEDPTHYVVGTDGSLAINSRPSAGYQIGVIPERAFCKVYPERSQGNWVWTEYNGVSGYCYNKYLVSIDSGTVTRMVQGTDGDLAINKTASAKYPIGMIPEGASCTVYPDRCYGNWVWTEYNGVSGYCYKKYLVSVNSFAESNVVTGIVQGTDGNLAINKTASVKYPIGMIPEGASCKVYTDKFIGNWVLVEYGGVSGYAYSKYIKF